MIIERHGERIDLAQEAAGLLGSKYGNRPLAAYLALSVEQSYIDPRDADGEWGDEQGNGALRFGRHVYRRNDQGFHWVDRFDTVAEAEAAMPKDFDQLCADIEALPLVERLQAGFGLELAICDRPAEQLANLLLLTFRACEALAVVAHDWGHYRLVTAVRSTVDFKGDPRDDWTVEDSSDWTPMTEVEAMDHAAALAEDDNYGEADAFVIRWLIGSHFYRADAEAEALQFLAMLNRADGQARAEGVEL